MNSRTLSISVLPVRQQLLWGVAASAIFAYLVITSGSAVPLAVLCALAVAVFIIRDPVRSLFAVIIINVTLSLRPASQNPNGAPSTLDLLMGVCLVTIMGYWLIKLFVVERQTLSTSVAQLLMAIFMIWSVATTAYAIVVDGNSFNAALREILNLSPLFVLPILYERFIDPESKEQKTLFVIFILIGCIQVVWNIYRVRSSMQDIVYLYEVGRGNTDETFSAFLMLIGASVLIAARNRKQAIFSGLLFLLGWVGIVICLSRTVYVAGLIGLILIVLISGRRNYFRGSIRIMWTVVGGLISLIPLYVTSRIIRLLAVKYLMRFLSTGKYKTDLSLLNRYSEWKSAWFGALHSPVLGNGFGSRFRYMQIIAGVHNWTAFSHSSYLYILFKVGFFAALCFFSAYAMYLYKGIMLLRRHDLSNNVRTVLLACVVYIILMVIYAYTAPVLDTKTDMVWVGLIWGYFLATEKRVRESEKVVTV